MLAPLQMTFFIFIPLCLFFCLALFVFFFPPRPSNPCISLSFNRPRSAIVSAVGKKKKKQSQGHLLAFIAKDNVEHSISVRYENHRLVLSPGAAHCARGEIKNKTPINKTEPGVRPWHISYPGGGVLTGALGQV